MVYNCELESGRQVFIENHNRQTLITMGSSGTGQQQSQRNSFETGEWDHPPTLFKTSDGFVLRVEAEGNRFFFRLEASGTQTLSGAPSLRDADVLPLQKAAVEKSMNMEPMAPMRPMKPMQPMEPMQPLNSMKPMEMHMGNMSMRMGKQEQELPRRDLEQRGPGRASGRFCTQCGQPADKADRFCGRCGHQLKPISD
jgi:hypothetical protein